MVVALEPVIRQKQGSRGVLATRPVSLDGAVAGIVANGLGRSVPFLEAVYRRLAERHDLAGFEAMCKPSVAVAPDPAEFAHIAERADFAIVGFGGCGSCSARSIRDAIELEWAGVPAVCIVHEHLVGSVQAMARLLGHPDYSFVTVDESYVRTVDWTDEQIDELSARVAAQVGALLAGEKSPAATSTDSAAHRRAAAADATAEAVREISAILEADGGRMMLAGVDTVNKLVKLELVLDDANCADCVLPRRLLENVSLDIIRRHVDDVERVQVADPREAVVS